jgi:type I restriction enzyme S subunit
MELKHGYKQSEIGVIPSDWQVARLGDCLARRPSYGINAPAVAYSDRLPTYIRITDISEDGRFVPPLRASVRSAMSGQYYLEDGDIVLARTGASVGKSYKYRNEDGPLVYAGFLIRVSPNAARLEPEFASAYLKTGAYWRWVRLMSMRSGQPGINGNEYAQLPIPLPSLPEQRAIAEALSDADALLDGLDRLIAKKRDLKQATMQQLLTGKTRLPGFSGKWETMRLGELGAIKGGGTPSTTQRHLWDGGIPWCTPTDITGLRGRKYLTGTVRTISAAGLAASAAEIVPPRSLILTSRATVGECAINLNQITTNQGFKNIVPAPHIDVEFLYYLMTTQRSRLLALCAGSTFLEIGKAQLGTLEVLLPGNQVEQHAIAAVLSDMDAELEVLEARREKVQSLKHAMMQELLTGKTRLVAPEAAHA